MRVLHVAEAFGGGLMQMVIELAEGGVAAGDSVCIAYGTRPETPDDLRALIASGVELEALPWRGRHPHHHVAAGRALHALIARWRPDVVHLHASFSGVVGAVVVPRATPTIFSPHAFASSVPEAGSARRAFYRLLERFACWRATLVGAVSPSEADVASRLGAREVAIVPNGIALLDPEHPRPAVRRDAPGRPEVVAIGRTVAQRRPAATGRILASVRDIADVAWLGGGGGGRGVGGAHDLIALGIEPTGWLDRDEVLRRLGAARIYLHWTAWDGMPLSVLEALALGLIVVASDIPPNRDVLGGAGVCATEDEAERLIRTLLSDAGAAAALRAAQQARAADFGAALMVKRWRTVHASLRVHAHA